MSQKNRLSVEEYVDGILNRQKVVFSKAITLIESRLASDIELAQQVLEKILPHTGQSVRIGITGVPGVGKSTFIEALGKYITSQHKKLAVLTIDPSSQVSRGSILGDKTRMAELAADPNAYIRPSPSQNILGGLSQRTRQTMLVCEAAGFEVLFIETVGVGQSETMVNEMTDCFLLLMLAGAGDELQGIKKGIMEMADIIAITKADGENIDKANLAKNEYQNALHLFPKNEANWYPQVLTCSAYTKTGIIEIWANIVTYISLMKENGFFEKKRQEQQKSWFFDIIRENLETKFYQNPEVRKALPQIIEKIQAGKIPPVQAAQILLNIPSMNE